LDLVKDRVFNTEDEFRDYLAPKLVTLFEIKKEQIKMEVTTTSFGYGLSNRADIIIEGDFGRFRKALIVFELKLSKSVEKFKNGDYTEAIKQLKIYCQDTRAPYGILLTENFCAIYRNKYFSYDQEPKRIEEDVIPSIDGIQNIMTRDSALDFSLQDKSSKYFLVVISFFIFLYYFFSKISESNLFFSLILSFLVFFVLYKVTIFLINKYQPFD